jgi:Pyruvate/2-oxoacid:ferredoxin oxidoreductase delta subunit
VKVENEAAISESYNVIHDTLQFDLCIACLLCWAVLHRILCFFISGIEHLISSQ